MSVEGDESNWNRTYLVKVEDEVELTDVVKERIYGTRAVSVEGDYGGRYRGLTQYFDE